MTCVKGEISSSPRSNEICGAGTCAAGFGIILITGGGDDGGQSEWCAVDRFGYWGRGRTESRRGGCWDRLCGEERIESRVEEGSETRLKIDLWGSEKSWFPAMILQRGMNLPEQDFETWKPHILTLSGNRPSHFIVT